MTVMSAPTAMWRMRSMTKRPLPGCPGLGKTVLRVRTLNRLRSGSRGVFNAEQPARGLVPQIRTVIAFLVAVERDATSCPPQYVLPNLSHSKAVVYHLVMRIAKRTVRRANSVV